MKNNEYETEKHLDSITIERHETIAVIYEGNGPETMIEAAFKVCGEYLSNNVNGQPMAIQFKAHEMLFNITVEPE